MIDRRKLWLAGALVALPAVAAGWYFHTREHTRSDTRERWPDPGPTMSVRQAHNKMAGGQMTLIDIRSPEEWRETGIARGAHAVTMHQDNKVFVERVREIAAKAKGQQIGLICHSGRRSAMMLVDLQRAGLADVVNVAEGMVGGRYGPGWIGAGLPVDRAEAR